MTSSDNFPTIVLDSYTGRKMPQAVEVEEIILGAILLEKDCLPQVNDLINEDCFYLSKHRMVYQAIMALNDRSEAIDIMTVTIELKRMGNLDHVGGPFFITQLTGRVASAANIQFHAMIIKQEWIRRKIIEIGINLSKTGFDDTIDAISLLQAAQLDLDNITSNLSGKKAYTLKELGDETKRDIFKRVSDPNFLPGEKTGFHEVDDITLGLTKTDLVVLAARPGMGKTAFATQVAKYIASDRKKPVIMFSLEMKDRQLVQRIIAGESGINSMYIQRGKLDYDEQKRIETLDVDYSNFIIDDRPSATLQHIGARMYKVRAQMGDLGLVVVDYLQLMKGNSTKSEHRELEISSISRGLKGLAKEFNVPILALSQLSRAVETRADGKKIPQLSDLRESGSIEQDADSVWFLWRPAYYKIKQDDEQNFSDEDCFVIIAKNRHGALGRKKIRFIPRYVKFENYTDAMPAIQLPFKIDEKDEF